jgi:hypothetical protein
VPTGHNLILAASFEKDSIESDHTSGLLSLYQADRLVGQAKMKTQLGAFAVAGAAVYVGRHIGEPVTDDYAGQSPYAFTGGTIDRVAVDVSGEPYVDLEREAQLMIIVNSRRSRLREVTHGCARNRVEPPRPSIFGSERTTQSAPSPPRVLPKHRQNGRQKGCPAVNTPTL